MQRQPRWAVLIVSSLSTLWGCGDAAQGEDFDSARTAVSDCSDPYEFNGPYTSNGRIDLATRLNAMRDSGGNEWLFDSKVGGGDDEDWFVFQAVDELGSLQPTIFVDLDDAPGQHAFDYLQTCVFSTLPGDIVECAVGDAWTYDGWSGCCATDDRSDEMSVVSLDLGSAFFDDTSNVYVRIRHADGVERTACTSYSLGYQAVGVK